MKEANLRDCGTPRIEARAYSIGRYAAHDFWVLRNAEGKVLGQLHGLATSPEGRIKPIGTFNDRLKFYHFGLRAGSAVNLDFVRSGQRAQAVYSGNLDAVLARWDHAVAALPCLNRLDLPYTPFGILNAAPLNSNTAYALLGKLMAIEAPCFSGCWQPGWGNADSVLARFALQERIYSPAAAESRPA